MAQTTAAAVLAWEVALAVLPERRPAFAPLTAIIALGATVGQRGTRALQVAIGVAVGLGVANVAVRFLGAGAWQLGIVTLLALVAAVVVSSNATLVVQAGVSGALVVAVGHTDTVFPYRFFEALVGAGVALLFSQVLFPTNAVASVRRSAGDILELVGDGLCRGAGALRASDDHARADAHQRLRDAASHLADLDDALQSARRAQQVTRPSPRRGTELEHYLEVPAHLESVVSDSSALLRAAFRAVENGSDRGETAQAVATVGGVAAHMAHALRTPGTTARLAPVVDVQEHGEAHRGADSAGIPQAVLDLSSSARERLRRLNQEIDQATTSVRT